MRITVLLVLLSGCLIPFDGDDDDDLDCDELPTLGLRDPQTGTCTPLGRVGGACKTCGNCAPGAVDTMDRAECGVGPCERLTEQSCLGEDVCRTVYALDDDHYLGCWGTAPSGALDTGTCAGLDAYQCSRHSNCSAWFVTSGGSATAFDHCGDAPSPASCARAACDPDKHCVQECAACDAPGGASCGAACHATCVPDQGCDEVSCPLGAVCRESCLAWSSSYPQQCAASCQPLEAGSPGPCDGAITCAASPPACPDGTTAGRADGCYTGFCIPTTACSAGRPGTCEPGRASTTPPACPAGTVAGTTASEYTGYCIPLAACGSSPLGTCEPTTSPMTPPACPDGSLPGTIDGRYTGACIPAGQCPQLPCDALVTEPACAARTDCRAIDRGQDCTCAAAGCSCASVQFDRCDAVASGPSAGG